MSRVRLLVVEDDAAVADLNQRIAKSLGLEVCGVAATAADAIRLAGQARPDFVLMDIGLVGPGDGIEAACEILQRFGIRSVFLTGEADPDTRDRASAAEPLGYLMKPLEFGDLLRCL